jgi:hypothetical protein
MARKLLFGRSSPGIKGETAMRCRKCDQSVSASDAVCPACGCPVNAGRLSAGIESGLARGAREDLERVRAEALLARQDSAAALTRDLCELSSGAPSPSEIDGMLDRWEGAGLPSLTDLEQLVASGGSGTLAIEGVALGELLEHGVDGRELLRKGMVFLRNGRHREALEWWTLNRQRLEDQNAVDLLLLIMEMLTWMLMGDYKRAADVRQQVRLHPCFARLGRK